MNLNRMFSSIPFAAFLAAFLVIGLLYRSQPARADGEDNNGDSRISIGLRIAPVPLNLKGRNRALVGVGSYIVNAQGDCNGCHSPDPSVEFLPGGVPYFGQSPTKINPAVYLSGGRDFGPLIPGSAHIVSRNLTPDKTGLPEGGASLQEFLNSLQHGVDADHLHPTCVGPPNAGCIPAPFDGSKLQIMPWPIYQNMMDNDLRAIYEYLSAIPCIAGPPKPSPLHHDCS